MATEPTRPAGSRVVWISTALLVALYLALFLSGIRFFILKTALLPVVLACGLFARERIAFVHDWLPFVSATLLFDAIRGAIWLVIQGGYFGYHIDYVIEIERALFRLPVATVPLQVFRTPVNDLIAVLIHASHFLFFFVFGLMLWAVRRDHFRPFRRALVLVMMIGLVGYALIPTAPPWAAASLGHLPPLSHITREIYTHGMPELYGAFATNPVAAMPSLHVAFPAACAITGWRAYGPRIGSVLAVYVLAVALASVYLGEHYAVDAVAGIVVAGVSVFLAQRMAPLNLSFRATVSASAAGFALTFLLVQLGAALPPKSL